MSNKNQKITYPILVTGAAGQVGAVGFKIVEQLQAKAVPVRRHRVFCQYFTSDGIPNEYHRNKFKLTTKVTRGSTIVWSFFLS